MAVITPEEIRLFISDDPNTNLLIDNGVEFSDARINLSIELAMSTFDAMPPRTKTNVDDFPSKSILLYGTLAKLYEAEAANTARNHMSYSDGGVTLPIEEHYPMYIQLASTYGQLFVNEASRFKVETNLGSGWGEVGSDYSTFPIW